MNGKQQLIAAGGVGLLGASFFTGGGGQIVATAIDSSKASAEQVAAARKIMVRTGSTLLGIGVAVLAAGASDAWASALVAIIAGLWLLWVINRYGGGVGKPDTQTAIDNWNRGQFK